MARSSRMRCSSARISIRYAASFLNRPSRILTFASSRPHPGRLCSSWGSSDSCLCVSLTGSLCVTTLPPQGQSRRIGQLKVRQSPPLLRMPPCLPQRRPLHAQSTRVIRSPIGGRSLSLYFGHHLPPMGGRAGRSMGKVKGKVKCGGSPPRAAASATSTKVGSRNGSRKRSRPRGRQGALGVRLGQQAPRRSRCNVASRVGGLRPTLRGGCPPARLVFVRMSSCIVPGVGTYVLSSVCARVTDLCT